MQITMKIEKTTPGTVRFKEQHDDDTEPDVLRTLYIQKHAVAELGNPEVIRVTIEPVP